MTAANCFVTSDEVHIFTDGAVYESLDNLSVIGFGSKVLPLPQYGAAIASNGFYGCNLMLAGALTGSEFADFDDLERFPLDAGHCP